MRNISFALTKDQIRNQTKTVTRRNGWLFLKVGDLLQPVEKGQGIKKGEKVVKLGDPIEIVSIRTEPLQAITDEDVAREGFPAMTAQEFIDFYCKANRTNPHYKVTRIEFKYISPIVIKEGESKPRSGAVFGTMAIEKAREVVSAVLECGFHDVGLSDNPRRPAWPVQYTLEELLIANRVIKDDLGELLPDGRRSMMMHMADRGVAARYALAHYGENPNALLESLGYTLSEDEYEAA
jgi:hypothetical protein